MTSPLTLAQALQELVDAVNYDMPHCPQGKDCGHCQRLDEVMKQAEAALLALPSAPQEPPQADLKRKAVANCYMMAKREIARILNGKAQVDTLSLERWQHVLRFCEESGEKSSILRDGLPTEMTEGASAPQEPPQEPRCPKCGEPFHAETCFPVVASAPQTGSTNVAALVERMTCRHGYAHYCANCGGSLDDVLEQLRALSQEPCAR